MLEIRTDREELDMSGPLMHLYISHCLMISRQLTLARTHTLDCRCDELEQKSFIPMLTNVPTLPLSFSLFSSFSCSITCLQLLVARKGHKADWHFAETRAAEVCVDRQCPWQLIYQLKKCILVVF